jgi:UDPglucose 6-dehydrogenase
MTAEGAPSVARVAVVGAGYVGLATAIGLAERGWSVALIEKDADRLEALVGGTVPIFEPGLAEAYTAHREDGRVVACESLPEDALTLVVICVGTPVDSAGYVDSSQVARALDEAAPAVARGAACVIRSTLPVGSAARFAQSSKLPPERLFLAPEFLRQGSALSDIRHPTRVIVGTFTHEPDPDALAAVTAALSVPGCPLLVMAAEEASLVKNASNVFLALRLTFANEVAGLAEDLGVDVGPVLEGIGHDPRIGRTYLRPSYGFGGSCLPKEVRTLSSAGLDRGLPMHLAAAVSEANLDHQRRFARRIAQAVGGLPGKRIGLLGLSFKADTDDVRSSPAIWLAARLLDEGAIVRAHDPAAGHNAKRVLPDLDVVGTVEEALQDADAAVIATEWPEFADFDWARGRAQMRSPLVFDGRRLLPPGDPRLDGYDVRRLGDGTPSRTDRLPLAGSAPG